MRASHCMSHTAPRSASRSASSGQARLVAALQGLQWSTYYEGFRGDTALDPKTNYLANMREEVARKAAASGREGCSL